MHTIDSPIRKLGLLSAVRAHLGRRVEVRSVDLQVVEVLLEECAEALLFILADPP